MTFRLLIITTLLFFGCTASNPEEQNSNASSVVDSTLVLGVSPFDNYRDVVENKAFKEYKNSLAFLESDQLLGFTAKCDVKVVLDDSVATQIHADVFPTSAAETEALWQRIFEHVCVQYGQTTHDDGFAAWTNLTRRDRKFEIHLTNDSREVGKPYIVLVCNEKH
ncbi:MAG: hypothetical protein GC193_04205 [Cryomorphaceae bacterium]|nr:hypothetical protein [Cryomorphaceae bacterium]